MEKILSISASCCDKVGGRLILISLLAMLVLYFTVPERTYYGIIAFGVGLGLFTIGAYIQVQIENAAKPERPTPSTSRRPEKPDDYASALAKRWIAEFESKYG